MTKTTKPVEEQFMVYDNGDMGYCGNAEWHKYTMKEILENYSTDRIPELEIYRIGERLTLKVTAEIAEYVAPKPVAKTKKPKAKKAKKKK